MADPPGPTDPAGSAGPANLASVPGYSRTWTAATVSAFGSYVTALAVGVLIVADLDGGATDVGLVNAARWLPYLVFGLVMGVLVDHLRRRPLLVGADLGRAVLLGAVPLLWATDRLSVGWLAVLMAGFGLLNLTFDAAFQSFVPRLVPAALLTPAHARFDQSDAVAQTSGPALAGALVSLVGAPLAVLVDALSFLCSGLLLWRMGVVEPPSRRPSLRGVPRQAWEGLRWVYRHPTLRPLALGGHGWFLSSAVAGAVVTPYALRTLGLSAFSLGLALAVAGVGALVGSSLAVKLGRRFGAGRVVIGCYASGALAWSLMALAGAGWPGQLLFFAGQLFVGFDIGTSSANEMGYRQTVTPDRLQGRMNASMRSINRAMVVVGAPVGGVLGDALGYRTMLWVAAAGLVLVGTALGLTRFRRARVGDAFSAPA